MAIPERFRLLSPASVTREINGEDFTFYTVSLRVAAKMAPLLSRLAGHFSTLLSGDPKQDQGRIEEDFATPEGEVISKTTVQPINPELATMRAEKREQAIRGAVDALLDPQNRRALGELLMDSLRDDFPRGAKNRDAGEIQEFVDGMDIPVFIEFLKGLAAANAKVFGDLGNGIGRAVQARAKELLGEAAEPDLVATGTDGSNSKTPTSS